MGFLVEYVPGGHWRHSSWHAESVVRSVYFMTEDRFRVLDVPLAAAMVAQHFGSARADPPWQGGLEGSRLSG